MGSTGPELPLKTSLKAAFSGARAAEGAALESAHANSRKVPQELQAIMDAWPNLSESVRQAIALLASGAMLSTGVNR